MYLLLDLGETIKILFKGAKHSLWVLNLFLLNLFILNLFYKSFIYVYMLPLAGYSSVGKRVMM